MWLISSREVPNLLTCTSRSQEQRDTLIARYNTSIQSVQIASKRSFRILRNANRAIFALAGKPLPALFNGVDKWSRLARLSETGVFWFFLLVLNCMQIVFCETIKVLICDVVSLFTKDRFPIGQNGHKCSFQSWQSSWVESALLNTAFNPSPSAHAHTATSTQKLHWTKINWYQNDFTQCISIYDLHRRISILLWKRILIHEVAWDGLSCEYFRSERGHFVLANASRGYWVDRPMQKSDLRSSCQNTFSLHVTNSKSITEGFYTVQKAVWLIDWPWMAVDVNNRQLRVTRDRCC